MAESGIYEIVNLVNGKRYVGSAVNLKQRKIDHWKRLRRGSHHCRHLQSSWKKHGEGAFEFRPIERVSDKDNLIEREQHYIDTLNPEYNTARKAGSCLGVKHRPESIAKRVAKFPKSFGAETRRRVAEAGRRKWAEPGYRDKMLEARRDANRRPEVRAKKSAASFQLWRNERHRTRMSELRRGTGNPAAIIKRFTIVNSAGETLTGIPMELRKATGMSPAGMSQLINGKQQTAKGWRLAAS